MSCPDASAPINIVYNLAGDCQLKCDYEPHYNYTSVSAKNKGDYILYTFDQTDAPTTFNTEVYNVTNMRLYQPSLHQYGGTKSGAELLISHINVSKNTKLIVCIPVDVGQNSESVLDSLIGDIAARANSEGGATKINSASFNISSLVPMKPFYSYNGTTPFKPCNESANYVVFDKLHAIKISESKMNDLKNVINTNNHEVKKNPNGFFYNKTGPSKGKTSDDIYIDCKPTGSDGKTLVYQEGESGIDTDESSADYYLKKMIGDFDKPWLISLLISVCIMAVLIKSWYSFDEFLTKPKTPSAPAVTGK